LSANIFCRVCGARPYPELSLPEVVRQDFDLKKVGGEWRCSKHRVKAAPANKKAAPADERRVAREGDAERIQRIFDELAARIDDDETDDLVAEAKRALERLAS
jgi:hypothetical protein